MKKLTALLLTSGAFIASAGSAFAETINVNPCASNAGPGFNILCSLSITTSPVVSRLITLALIVAALISLAFLIFGGIRWILSGGEKEKVEAARGTIIAALVGLVIVFAAYFIINIVFSLFGLNGINSLTNTPAIKIFQ